MIKVEIKSQVDLGGIKAIDTYIEEFDDNENVFSKILKYHGRMQKVFPNCAFRLVSVEEIGERNV